MRLKFKFGAIRGAVRGVIIFWSDFWAKIRHQIVSLMSCGWVIYYFFVSTDNQFDSGFAIRRALLYAISNVKQVCP